VSKTKQIWGWLVAGVTGLVGLLLYMLTRKGEEINSLKAKVAIASTEKEADALETEIKAAASRKNNLKKQNEELDKTLAELETKRKKIKVEVSNMTDPKAISDYWDNN